jgi:hypothetical protein
MIGVTELMNRAAEQRERMEKQKDGSREKICVGLIEEGVAISSALSLALHIFNRIMVSISALSDATTTYQ